MNPVPGASPPVPLHTKRCDRCGRVDMRFNCFRIDGEVLCTRHTREVLREAWLWSRFATGAPMFGRLPRAVREELIAAAEAVA